MILARTFSLQPVLPRRVCSQARTVVQAFTLIEVLLATAIFAIVLVAINTVFFAGLHLRQRVSAAVDESMSVNQALTLLRRDLQNVVPPGGVLAGNFRGGSPGGALSSSTVGAGASGGASGATGQGTAAVSATALNGGFDFFTSTGTLSDEAPYGDIQEVNYQLVETGDPATALGKDLVRNVTRNLLSFSTPSTETQQLASNIETLEFYFYDGTQWRDTWDTSAADTRLPLAVKVRILPAVDPAISTARREPMEMLVLLNSQATTNQTQTAGAATP